MKKNLPLARLSIAAFLLLGLLLVGCRLFGPFDSGDVAGVALSPKASGNANVRFNLVLPDASLGNQPYSYVIADTGANSRVTFRLFLFDRSANQKITVLSKTVDVSGGVAEVDFPSIPALTTVAEAEMENGNYGGYSFFHGSHDLIDGENVVTLAPKGSGHRADLAANAVMRVMSDPALQSASPLNLATVADFGVSLIATGSISGLYGDLFDRLVGTSLRDVTYPAITRTLPRDGITWPDAGVTRSANVITDAQYSAKSFQVQQIVRQRTGSVLVLWRATDGSASALTALALDTHLPLATLFCDGPCGLVVPVPGGGFLVGGSLGNVPVVFKWDGTTSGKVSEPGTAGVAWIQRSFVEAGGAVSLPEVGYLEFVPADSNRLLCTVRDPHTRLPRLFRIDFASGAIQRNFPGNGLLPLWAIPGDGTITLGWDPIPGSVTYNLYWHSLSSVSPTQNSGSIINATSPFTHSGPTLSSPTFFLLTWRTQDGASGTSSIVRASPFAPPVFSASFKLGTGSIDLTSQGSAVQQTQVVGSNTIYTAPVGLGIASGSILLGGATNGYPKKVIGVATAGGVITITTVDANLCDVYETASFSYDGPLSQLTNTTVAATRAMKGMPPIAPSILATIYHGVDSKENVDVVGAGDPNLSVTLNKWNWSFSPMAKLFYVIDGHELKFFSFGLSGRISSEIEVATSLGGEKSVPMVKLPLALLVVPGVAGVVPFTVEVAVPFEFSAKAGAKATATIGNKGALNLQFLTMYHPEQGGWKTSGSLTFSGSPTLACKLEGNLSEEAAIKVQTSLKVAGLLGPQAEVGTGLELSATADSVKPWLIPVALKLKGTGSINVVVEALTWTFVKFTTKLFEDKEWPLAERLIDLNTPPTVSILDGPTTITEFPVEKSITFQGEDTGLFAGIDRYWVGIDENPPKTDNKLLKSFSVPETISNGNHVFRVMAQDRCGATSPTALFNFTVSKAPPAWEIGGFQQKQQLLWPVNIAIDKNLTDNFDRASPVNFYASPPISGIKNWDFGDGMGLVQDESPNYTFPMLSPLKSLAYTVRFTNLEGVATTLGKGRFNVLEYVNVELFVKLQYEEWDYFRGMKVTRTSPCGSFSAQIFHKGRLFTVAEKYPVPGYPSNWYEKTPFSDPVLRLPVDDCTYTITYRDKDGATWSTSGNLGLVADGIAYPPPTSPAPAFITVLTPVTPLP